MDDLPRAKAMGAASPPGYGDDLELRKAAGGAAGVHRETYGAGGSGDGLLRAPDRTETGHTFNLNREDFFLFFRVCNESCFHDICGRHLLRLGDGGLPGGRDEA